MKVKAKRTKEVSVGKEIEVVSVSTKVHHDIAGDGLWMTLKRKCFVCRKLFKGGDSVTIGFFIEDGVQLSGGCHLECVKGENNA